MKRAWHFIKKHKIIIGGIWAFITTCLSLYLSFFPPEQNPCLTFYQKAKFDAFTVDKSIEDLQIFFKGVDIRKSNLNLRIYKFKLVNNGKRDIKDLDYVKEISFGMGIKNGRVARIIIDKVAKNGIASHVFDKINEDSTEVLFNKIFIGRNDYMMFDLWVIHKSDSEPELISLGRIADTQIVLTSDDETGNSGLYDLLKAILVIALLIFGLIVVVYLIELIITFLKEQIRHLIIKRILGNHLDQDNKMQRLIIKVYCTIGKKKFIEVMKVLINDKEAEMQFREEIKYQKVVKDFFELEKNKKIETREKNFEYESKFLFVVLWLKEIRIVQENEGKLIIKEEFLNEVNSTLKLFNS